MKRILVFSHEFPPALGGAGSVALQNASMLANSGFEVQVLTKSGGVGSNGFKLKTVAVYSRLWFFSYIVFCLLNRKWLKQFDLILLNDPGSIYIAGLCFPNVCLAKSLCFMHGSEIETVLGYQSLPKSIQLFRRFFLKAINASRKVIFPSKWLEDKFKKHPTFGKFFINSEVVYAGVDNSVFYEVESDIRSKHNIPESALLLLSVSRIVKEKGYEEMYSVIRKLHELKVEVYWLVVGEGRYLVDLKQTINNHGFQNFVLFTGGVNRKELRFYYSAADVFLLMSNYEESFGLVYLESAACGTPAIGLDKGGVSESIDDHVSGFVVETEEECIQLLKNGDWKRINPEDLKAHSKKMSSMGLLTLTDVSSL